MNKKENHRKLQYLHLSMGLSLALLSFPSNVQASLDYSECRASCISSCLRNPIRGFNLGSCHTTCPENCVRKVRDSRPFPLI